MRHREYLQRLHRTKREHGLVEDGPVVSEREPILPSDSPVIKQALINIMRKTGFTEEQIAKRFGTTPEPTEPSEGLRRAG